MLYYLKCVVLYLNRATKQALKSPHTNNKISLSLNLKKPTPPTDSIIPFTSYSFFSFSFFFGLLWYTSTSNWYRCLPAPKTQHQSSVLIVQKNKNPDQFFLPSCFLKQITQHISLSNFEIWNLVTAWWVFFSFLSIRHSSLFSVFYFIFSTIYT